MSGYWQSFARAARPLQLICDLDRPLQAVGNRYLTPCPCCGNQLQILASGFVCPNRDCTFRAGGAVDYLRIETDSYGEALNQLRNMYGDTVRQLCGAESWEVIRDQAAKQGALQRRLFIYFLKLRQRSRAESIEGVRLHSWLASNKIDLASCNTSAFLAAPEDLKELQRLLREFGDEEIPAEIQHAVLFPYFGDHHTVSSILIYNRAKAATHEVRVTPYRFAFSGLLEPAEDRDTVLCHNHVDAAILNSRYRQFQHGKICYAVLFNPAEQELGFMPEIPVFMHKTKGSGDKENLQRVRLSMLAALAAHYQELHVAGHDLYDEPHPAPPVPWEMFVMREGLALLEAEQGLTAAVRTFLESARPSPRICAELSRELRSRNLRKLAEALESYFREALLYKDAKVSLFATASGYTAVRRDGMRSVITNFTCSFDHNLVFPQSPDVYHVGQMFFDGHDYPLIINSKDLDNPRQFENAARLAEMRFTGEKPSNLVPAVPDRKYAAHLINHLRGTVCHLDRIEGTPFLGWDISRRNFFGPSWHVTAGRVSSRTSFMHPDYELLQHYSAEELPMLPPTSDLPRELCDVISQAVAMSARIYLHHPVQPIKYLNTPGNRNVLGALFAGLGQQTVIPLSFNGRTALEEMKGLQGFPSLAAGYNRSQTERASLPVFMLLDYGFRLSESHSPEVLARAASVFRAVMARSMAWLLSTQGSRFHRHSSVSYDAALAHEGEAVIREACELPDWAISAAPYQTVENALRQIPVDRVADYFSHDLASQQVYFNFAGLAGVDVTDLELDLRQMSAHVQLGDGVIMIDALSAMQLLCNFYQETPRLKSLQLEQVVEELESRGAAQAASK